MYGSLIMISSLLLFVISSFEKKNKIDWQNYSVLARASNDYYLKIKETLLIKERIPIMNNNETSVILNLF